MLAIAAAVVILAACDQSSPPSALPFTLYDDFSSGTISGAKWAQGQHQAVLENKVAVLSHAISAVRPNTAYSTVLALVPPPNSAVTTLRVGVQITSTNFTRDTTDRATMDLWFQPAANRLGPTHLANSLFARISFAASLGTGLVVQRQLFECTSDDCSTFMSIGRPTGNWPGAGVPFSLGTPYSISISIDPAAKTFTFCISGGAYTTPKMTTFDVSTVVSPFPVDVSASNFYRARFLTQVRGGANGGGDGSIRAEFDHVNVGLNGGAPSLFDDFNSGSVFDSTKWSVAKESVQVVASGLQIALTQKDATATVPMNLTDSNVSALQTDLTVSEWNLTGQGRLVARIEGTLYNDGTNGSGMAPDVNGPGSEVGDVLASVNMTATNVFYSILRCDNANCSSSTSIRSASLGAVTLGTTHTLLMQLDASTKKMAFQLDNKPMVTVDPGAAGYPFAAPPSIPFRQIAVRASPIAPSDSFTGSITATFDNVKTM